MTAPRLRALVTSGGTREPIDDVRVLTNVSSGRLGAAIARALAARGVETTVLGSPPALAALASQPAPPGAPLHAVRFDSFADLQRELERLTADPPDLLFMVAAPADYSPVYHRGKLSSMPETLTLELEQNPKLLAGLRERCGPETTIVGFKLLAGASQEDLLAVAYGQTVGCQIDLTVANDKHELSEHAHPVYLVPAEGDPVRLEGERESVAERLVSWTLEHRAPPAPVADAGPPPARGPAWERARELLSFLEQTRLLRPGQPGSASVRASERTLWTTPAELSLDAERLVHVTFTAEGIEARGGQPTPDAAIHGWLLEHLPGLVALVRCQAGLALPTASSPLPVLRGSAAEAQRIYVDLAEAAEEGSYPGGGFLIRLADDELLLGLTEGDLTRMQTEWTEAHRGLAAALAGIEAAKDLELDWQPILAGPGVIGLEASPRGEGEDWTTIYLMPARRGHGLGALVLDHLDERGDTVGVPTEGPTRTFLLHRGYREKHRRGGLAFLIPPSKRRDLQPGASVCLYDPLSARVLLGLRLRPPWQDRWSFPGGSIQEGETAIQAALRELKEETGLDAPVDEPWASETVIVGDGTGEQSWTVTCFLIPCLGRPQPRRTDELDAEWVPLDEALERELTPGVRPFLHLVIGGQPSS